ncbi:MAG: hypothetical protein JRI92_01275 [Deltaproteobacteria bacterium]|nr:hypothetical protein [Deltaproteobacteria bacterium]
MLDLENNRYYKRLSGAKPKLIVFIFIFSAFFFIGEILFIYLKFIPTVIDPFKKVPEMYDQLRFAFDKVLIWLMVWPLSFFALLGAVFYSSWITQKFFKSIEQKKYDTSK